MFSNQNENGVPVNIPPQVIEVTSGLRYRLRFINGGSLNCPIMISIDGHNFTVIASDGNPIEPVTASSLIVFEG